MKTKTTNRKLLTVIISVCLFSVGGIINAKPWNDRVVDSLYQFVLPSEFLYGLNEWAIGDGCSDMAEVSYCDTTLGDPGLQYLSVFKISGGMKPVATYYRWNYFGIGLCNQYLKWFQGIGSPSIALQQQKAGVLFFRSLFYFNLVKVFGDVPLFTEGDISKLDTTTSKQIDVLLYPDIQSDSIHKPRIDKNEVWDNLDSCLNVAIAQLPLRSQLGSDMKGKITKGAAQMLLLKINIYRQNWPEALTEAEDIVNFGEYSLEAKLDGCFNVANKFGIESIFEINQPPIKGIDYGGPYWISANQNVYQSMRNLQINYNPYPLATDYYGWGFNCPTDKYVKSFAPGDPRLKFTVLAQNDSIVWDIDPATNDTTWVIADPDKLFTNNTGSRSQASPTGYYQRKYMVTDYDWRLAGINPKDSIQHTGGIKNIIVFRYAEVLLFAAEAAFQTGDTTNALTYINMVRARARGNGNSGVPADLTSLTLDSIMNERSWELGSEGHRYFDLIRTNKAEEILNGSYSYTFKRNKVFDPAKNYLLPIPIQDLAINKGVLTQNPGYETLDQLEAIHTLSAKDSIVNFIDTTNKSIYQNINITWNNYFNLQNLIDLQLAPKFSVKCYKGNIESFTTQYPQLNGYYDAFIYNSGFVYSYTPNKGEKLTFPFTDTIILAVNNFLNEYNDTVALMINPNSTNNKYNDFDSIYTIYSAFNFDFGQLSGIDMNNELMLDMLSDDAEKGGGGAFDLFFFNYWRTWQPFSLGYNPMLTSFKTVAFFAIQKANEELKKLEISGLPQDSLNRKKGEIYFVRSYFYFNLAKYFAQASTNNSNNFSFNVSLVDTFNRPGKLYAKIDSDLTEAINLLPPVKDWYTMGISPNGRATQEAAKALLAEVIMMEIGFGFTTDTSGWDRVYELTKDIINSGQYALLPNYAGIFEPEGEFGPESVFEINAKDMKQAYNGLNGNIAVWFFSPNQDAGGNSNKKIWFGLGFGIPTKSLYNEFEQGDPRLANTIIQSGDIIYEDGNKKTNEQINIVPISGQCSTGYYNRKVEVPYSMSPSCNICASKNKRLIRYADVLLMCAEAAYHIGLESEARDLVNQVRARARASTGPKGSVLNNAGYPAVVNPDVLPDVTASGDELLSAIKHERRVELALEGHRTWDLYRWGEYEDAIHTYVTNDSIMMDLSPESIVESFRKHKIDGVPSLTDIPDTTTYVRSITKLDNSIKVYPNPASDKLYIETESANVLVVITDLTGKILLSGQVKNKQVDIQLLSKGLYLISINTGKSYSVTKFIKR